MYHSISKPGQGLSVSPKDFDAQIEWLVDNGYTPITLGQLKRYWDGEFNVQGKVVVITFDDGYLDNYTDAYPILLKYHAPATIFVITDSIKRDNHMKWSQMQEMHKHGIEFGSHMVYHSNFLHTSHDQIAWELKMSKKDLEAGLNSPVTTFCYPGGGLIPEASDLVREAGYTMAVTTRDTLADRSEDHLLLSRVRVVGGESLQEFASKLQTP
ncbi:polysaccharide deacetylase family protein [Tumebacillus sp. ITR2]|uniref:Polysaccharide deacetylase family protein n=2 Tax=Tumebacillus amylolyticus TaxID=2801339 RepID=A0ABS1JGX5_9BACL|nr:polysaccharide deacetylase family protein [Tumebacillus amylolyticus]